MSGNNRDDMALKVPCEVYSRVVGYLRPVSAWNEGKRQEYADRVVYRQPEGDNAQDD